MKETVNQLLESKGVSSPDELDINQRLEYDGGQHHHDLSIERVGENRISVCQHYTKRMDLMRAPEVVFDYTDDEWTPVEYTNHDTVPQVYDANKEGLSGLDQLLETWEKNLQNQFSQYIDGGDSP